MNYYLSDILNHRGNLLYIPLTVVVEALKVLVQDNLGKIWQREKGQVELHVGFASSKCCKPSQNVFLKRNLGQNIDLKVIAVVFTSNCRLRLAYKSSYFGTEILYYKPSNEKLGKVDFLCILV